MPTTKKITTEASPNIFSLPYLVARDEGYFEAEGVEVEFVPSKEKPPTIKPIENPEEISSFGGPSAFEEGESSLYRACEWGQVRRSHDSQRGGRVIGKRAAVASQAIIVRPDSPAVHPQDLANRSVAVNFHHGSHYVAIQSLEGFLEPHEIKVVHFGGPQQRFEAVRDGRADAAAVMEPWITVAQKLGYKIITEAYYVGSEIASEDVDPESFEALNRAIARAVKKINEDPRPYLHYLINTVPSDIVQLEPEDFDVSRLRYVAPAPYPREQFERSYRWMRRWNLIPDDKGYEALVDNRIASPVTV